MLLALAACDSDPEPAADSGSTLRLVIPQPVASLDPLHAGSATADIIIGAIYDRLYRYALLERPYRLVPALAGGMPEISADRLTYTIKLRSGAGFHDDEVFGNEARALTASDVVYSILRHFDPANHSTSRWLWAGRIQDLDMWAIRGADYDRPPAGLEALDRHTLRITLTAPQADFLHLLAHPSSAVVAREAVEHYGAEYRLQPVGSGPYRLQRISLAGLALTAAPATGALPFDPAREGYRSERHAPYGFESLQGRAPPYIERIELRVERDPDRRWQWLTGGEVDLLEAAPMQHERFETGGGEVLLPEALRKRFRMRRQPAAELMRIDFNLHSDALGEAAGETARTLRCELRDAIDWQSFNERFYHGTGYVLAGVLSPLAFGTDDIIAGEAAPADTDPGFSRAAPLPPLVFAHADSERNRAYYQWFRGQLTGHGYPDERISARPVQDFNTLLEVYRRERLPLIFSAWGLDLPTAGNTLQLYAGARGNHDAASPGLANYRNPDYDELYRALAANHIAGREQAIRELQAMLDRDCVTATGFSPGSIHVWNRRVIAWPDSAFGAAGWLGFAALKTVP